MTLLAAVVLAHLALPWALRTMAAGGEGRRSDVVNRLAATVRRHPVTVYGRASIALGVLALATATITGWPDMQHTPWLDGRPAIGLCVALAVGAGFPLLMAWLAGRPRQPFAQRLPVADFTTIVLCASAEELLWRAVAFGLLIQVGLPLLVAAAVAVFGFALLHLPRGGSRQLLYQAVVGTLLTGLAVTAGLVAAIACHVIHNLVLLTSVRPRSRAAESSTVEAPVLPPARAWEA